ncbi:MAG: phosphoglycerate dehydrogenase [Candidatus Omnitrophica bacterium]|nr:phosphoglycerate dehydrogenase [Candidatus Omnitrophota bacterium]
MKIIAISTTSFAEYDKSPLELLEKSGYRIMANPYGRKIKPEELVKLAKDAAGLIAGTELIDRNIISTLPRLKVISRCGAGLDNVDLEAAKHYNIKVVNTPDAPTLAVAELTVGLMLNLLRKINKMDAAMRRGEWQKLMGNLLSNKKIGIIGFGKIGKKVAELLKPFGCEISYTDPNIKSSNPGFKNMPKTELLRWADILTIHASSTDKILGEKEFKALKKGAWIVNVSRGETVEEAALIKALKNNDISGAAIDVFEQEPYSGMLKELDNVILTPHIGSYAKEARINMELEAVRNLIKGLKEGA